MPKTYEFTLQEVGYIVGQLSPEQKAKMLYENGKLVVPETLVDVIDALDLSQQNMAEDARNKTKERVRFAIDDLAFKLTSKYTHAEQAGWLKTLPEAIIIQQGGNVEDAPGVALEAAMRGVPIADRAAQIIAAAGITGLVPNLCSGARSKAGALIDASDGSEQALAQIEAKLKSVGSQILMAVSVGDIDMVEAAALSDWSS